MSRFEFIRPWSGLRTIPDEAIPPLPPNTLSTAEQEFLHEIADAVVLDQTQPSPLPVLRDLYIAEPQHPAVVEPEV